MNEQEKPTILVRSQIFHQPKKETDFYITKNSIFSSLLPSIEKKIHKFNFVDIHSLGAANYKALKLALAVVKSHPNELDTEIKTETVGTNDFVLPVNESQTQETKHREINCVHIHIYRKEK